MTLFVLQQRVHGVYVFQRTTQLMGVLTVVHLQHTLSWRAGQKLTVAALQETGNVTPNNSTLYVFYLHFLETVTVIGLQGAVHTHIEKTVGILYHAVDIVAGHS